MARTGLRMMPTSPSSPLKFRTAGFPQYGFKAGVSDEAFPTDVLVKPVPGMPSHIGRFAFILRVLRGPVATSSEAGGRARSPAPVRATPVALPQGPSLSSGCSVPGFLACRPHPPHSQVQRDFTACGLYALPSLCGHALATREWFRAFAVLSLSTCRPLDRK